MTYDQIMEIKRLTQNVREKCRRNPEALQAVDALDLAITKAVNEDTRKSADQMRSLNAIQSGLESLRGYSLTRKQAA